MYKHTNFQPAYMFTDKEHRGPFEFAEELGSLSLSAGSVENVIPAQSYEASDNDLLLSTSEKEESRGLGNIDSAYNALGYDTSLISLEDKQVQPESNVLNLAVPTMPSQASSVFDDLLGLGTTDIPLPPTLKLNPKAVLDPGNFQIKWGQLATSLSQVASFSLFQLSLNQMIFGWFYFLQFYYRLLLFYIILICRDTMFSFLDSLMLLLTQ